MYRRPPRLWGSLPSIITLTWQMALIISPRCLWLLCNSGCVPMTTCHDGSLRPPVPNRDYWFICWGLTQEQSSRPPAERLGRLNKVVEDSGISKWDESSLEKISLSMKISRFCKCVFLLKIFIFLLNRISAHFLGHLLLG